MSRLVFYNWEEPGDVATMSAGARMMSTDGGPMLSTDRPWFQQFGAPEQQRVDLPLPCVSQSMSAGVGTSGMACRPWRRVRSIDLGACSLELRYGRARRAESFASQFMRTAGVADVALADDLLEGVLDAMTERRTGWQGLIWADVRVTPDREGSSWRVSPQNDELCLDVRYTLWHAPVVVLFIPISATCDDRPAAATICGSIDLNDRGELTWYTSSLTNGLDGNWSACRRQVVAGVTTALEAQLMRDDDASGRGNAISEALRAELGARLRVDSQEIRNAFADPDDDELDLLPRFCDDPSDGAGTPTDTCFRGIFSSLRGRCVASQSAPEGRGRCYYSVPIRRVERSPTGIELILVDHDESGIGLQTLLSFGRLGPASSMPRVLERDHCITPSTSDPRNVTTVSRGHERVLRRPQTHLIPER